MRRLTTIMVVVLAVLGACSGGQPERWDERGFDSYSECARNHGWDGSIGDAADRKGMFDFWCGPIEDG